MQIHKVFNNNVVLVIDNNDQESVVMGKGIGFQKKVGDTVDIGKIEKRFILHDEQMTSLFSNVYNNMPLQEVDIILAIIQLAEQQLQQSFQTNLYIALADHIQFALERAKKGMFVKNPLSYEVRKFYPQEFEVGKQAIALIDKQLGVTLNDDEATSIALHIVNAAQEGSLLERTIQITEIVQNIIDVVRMHYGVELDESDMAYNRFVTHLQYFAQRIVTKSEQGTNDSFLFEQVQANYPKAFDCTKKIKMYVEHTYDFDVGRDEQVYLTLHVQKLINK